MLKHESSFFSLKLVNYDTKIVFSFPNLANHHLRKKMVYICILQNT